MFNNLSKIILKPNLIRNFSSRKIVLDTETTGFNHFKDKIVSICAQEIINNKPGIMWHSYINPEGKKSSKMAQECHNIKEQKLRRSPNFEEISESFKNFIGDSPLVIHNASFDIHFLNSELKRINKKPLENRNICTLKMARILFPTKKNTLDVLCDRYKIDRSLRIKMGHGSIIDTELLSQLFLKMEENVDDEIMNKSIYLAPLDKWQ